MVVTIAPSPALRVLRHSLRGLGSSALQRLTLRQRVSLHLITAIVLGRIHRLIGAPEQSRQGFAWLRLGRTNAHGQAGQIGADGEAP